MSWYTPTTNYIQQIHDWRRPNAVNGLQPAPNGFNPDWNSANGKEYLEGIMSLAGAYFAIGILGFLLFAALNLSGHFCGGRTITKSKVPYTGLAGWLLSPSMWFLGGAIVMACGTSAALAQVSAFQKTVTDTGNAVNSFTGLLNAASGLVANGVLGDLGALNSSLLTLQAAAAAIPADPASLAVIAGMIDSTTASAASTTTVSSLLNSTVTSLNKQLGAGGNVDINGIGNKVYVGGAAALGIFLALLAVGVGLLLPKSAFASMFRTCNSALVVAFLLVYVFAGLFMAVAVSGSDVCVAPSSAIGRIANLTDSTASDTLLYYTTCQTSPGVVVPPTSGALSELFSGQASMNSTEQAFAAFEGPFGIAYPSTAADLAAVSAAIAATSTALSGVVADVGCLPVNGVYQQVLQALCGSGVPAIINVWALSTAACLIMLVLAGAGVRLCFRHPGDILPDPVDPRLASAGFGPASGTASYTILAGAAPSAYGSASSSSAAVSEWSKRPLPRR